MILPDTYPRKAPYPRYPLPLHLQYGLVMQGLRLRRGDKYAQFRYFEQFGHGLPLQVLIEAQADE